MAFLHRAEKRFAREVAEQLLQSYRAVRDQHPDLSASDVYERAVMLRGYDAESAHALVRRAEEGVSWWPRDRDLTFRDVVHYLAVSEYLEERKADDQKGTRVIFRHVIEDVIPPDL